MRWQLNPKHLTTMAVLLAVAVGVGYWLGYRQGRRSTTIKDFRFPTSAELPPKPSEPPIDPAAEPPDRQSKVPPRDPAAGAHLIDLTAWYNAGLTGDWHGSTPDNDFGTLPTGVQTLAGTEFDVRGLIQLRASDRGVANYPPRVEGIPLGLRCRKVHFLHNSLFARLVPVGEKVGAYVLHYADGESVTIPLRLGDNILDWWGSPDQLPWESWATLAWKGHNGKSLMQGKGIHLLKLTWENPRPDVELRAFDFVGENKTAGPFLGAVTVEP